MDETSATGGDDVHWLLPIDPASHLEHLPSDWRTRADATAVWRGVGLTQDPTRWCLRSGFRSMRIGDRIWAYLSRRQELCAVGTVRRIDVELPEGSGPARFVVVDWDEDRTAALCRTPLPRALFGQVPMSTCRARPEVATLLSRQHAQLAATASAGSTGSTAATVTASSADIERSIMDLLSRRREGATICPSEVARALGDQDTWRDLMDPVREVAAGLADAGRIEVTQRGVVVDVRTAPGPVRLRLTAPHGTSPGRDA